MKKLFSLLLCAAMLVSLPAGVLAVEPEEPAAEPTSSLTENAAGDAAQNDETQKESPEAYFLRTHPEIDRASSDEDGPSLMASTGSATVTVRLPDGVTATAGAECYVALLRQAEINSQGTVTSEPEYCYGEIMTIPTGASSFSFTAGSLEAGSYFCEVHPFFAHPSVPNGDLYINGNGTLADNKIVATGFSLPAGGSVNRTVQLPKATASISGTLTFSSALTEAAALSIGSSSEDSGVSNDYIYSEVVIPKGAASTAFSIGFMDRNAVDLDFHINSSRYYSVDNTLDSSWNTRNIFDLSQGSVSGLSVNGDALIQGGAGAEYVNVTMSVTLPEALTSDREFVFATFRADQTWIDDSRWLNAKAGATTVSTESKNSLEVETGKSYIFGYVDSTGVDGWNDDNIPGFRYISETGGVTSDRSQAKQFSFSQDSSVTLTEPSCWKITGTLSREAYFMNRTVAAMATADFPDGQSWGGRAVFQPDSSTASYTIYVPKTQSGAYTLSAVYAGNLVNLNADSNSWVHPEKTYPALSGNTAADPIAMKTPGVISGVVTLPQGVSAPQQGLAISFRLKNSYATPIAYAVIPAGQNSAAFSFPHFMVGSFPCYVETTQGMTPCMQGKGVIQASGGSASGVTIQLKKMAAISGTISLPAGVDSAGVFLIISASSDYDWFDSYRTIREGAGASTAYTLYVPDGTELDELCLYVQSTTNPAVAKSALYVNSDWTVGDESGDITVNGNHSGLDFTLKPAVVLSGTIVDEDGGALTVDTDQTYWLYYSNADTGDENSVPVSLDAQGNWSAGIPADQAGNLILYLYVSRSGNTNIISEEYYYTTGTKAVTDSDSASALTVSSSGASGIRIPVRTGCFIKGQVKLPEGAVVSLDYSSIGLNVSAKPTGGGSTYWGSCDLVNGMKTLDYSILVPKQAATYQITYIGTTWDSDYGSTNVLFNERITAEQTVTVNGKDATGPEFTLSLAKAVIRGTVTRPAGVGDDIYVSITVTTEKQRSYTVSVSLDYDSSAESYLLSVSSTDDSAWYTVEYEIDYSEAGGLAEQGYLTSSGVSAQSADAARFSFSDSTTHDFTLLTVPPFAQGKIYVPAAVTDPFELYIDANSFDSSNSESAYFEVDPSSLPSDSTGRYLDYRLYAETMEAGETYSLSVQVYYDENGSLDTNRFYVDTTGSLTRDYDQCQSYTCGGSVNTQDFTLLTWNDGAEDNIIQSEHGFIVEGYPDDPLTWSYTYPGECESLTIKFSTRTDQNITISTDDYSCDYYPGGGNEITVSGSAFTLRMDLYDSWGDRYYGFGVESVTPNDGATPRDGYAGVTTEKGSGDQAVLEQVRENNSLTALVFSDQSGTAAAALYDADGKYLGISTRSIQPSPAGQRVDFDFSDTKNAEQVRLFLCDEDWKPLSESLSFGT